MVLKDGKLKSFCILVAEFNSKGTFMAGKTKQHINSWFKAISDTIHYLHKFALINQEEILYEIRKGFNSVSYTLIIRHNELILLKIFDPNLKKNPDDNLTNIPEEEILFRHPYQHLRKSRTKEEDLTLDFGSYGPSYTLSIMPSSLSAHHTISVAVECLLEMNALQIVSDFDDSSSSQKPRLNHLLSNSCLIPSLTSVKSPVSPKKDTISSEK